jgi:RimJ/RimL family protein N-acetyltransferase
MKLAITTDRLTLGMLSIEDAGFIFELLNSESWLEFIGDRGIKTIEDAEKYILNGPVKSYATFGFGLLLVRLKKNQAPIGLCGLIKRETLQDIDIGFAFLPEHTGKGYALEAANATMNYAKAELGIKRIVAITTEKNRPSINLLNKIGLKFEKNIKLSGEEAELLLFSNS